MASVVERLRDAVNQHDLQALLECIDEGYRSEQPAHPNRAAVKSRSARTGQPSSRASRTLRRSCSDTRPTGTRCGASGIGAPRA
jgi:hypothetical protein